MILTHVLLLGAALLAPAFVQDRPQRPAIRSGVELVAIDLHVVDKTGQPVTDLRPADFEVWIDGKKRPIATADVIRFDGRASARPAPVRPVAPPGDATVAPSGSPRRMYIVAIDEHSLRVGTARAAMEAAGRFISRLQPDDLVGLYAYPTGIAYSDLTTDHPAVKAQLPKVRGLWSRPMIRFRLSISDIVDYASEDVAAMRRIEARECGKDPMCMKDLRAEVGMLVVMFEMQIDQSLGGLRTLVSGLTKIPGRKSLVLVSGGLFASDRAGGRLNISARMTELGRDAAAANVTLYALHMDTGFLDAFSADGTVTPTLFRDMNMMRMGLEFITGAAGGEVFRVQTGNADRVFDRVLLETSAHYLLGVDVAEGDRDGKAHTIRVRVKRRGLTVRSRNMVVVPGRDPLR